MPNLELNFNPNHYQLIGETIDGYLDPEIKTYLKVTVRSAGGQVVKLANGNDAIFYSTMYSGDDGIDIQIPGTVTNSSFINISDSLDENGDSRVDFKIYNNGDSSFYLKPNELLSQNNIPQGNYRIKVDFLQQYRPLINDVFVLTEISPSRLEARLKLADHNITQEEIDTGFLSNFISSMNMDVEGDNTDEYQFNHVLNIGGGGDVPIVNYTFDSVSSGDENQSIILKFYSQLPLVPILSTVTIEREVLISQNEDVYYFSETPLINEYQGLEIDTEENWINPQIQSQYFQNLDQLSSSLSLDSLDSLLTGSSYEYPNLNTDYNFFENHTFFGSAKRKLENFKNKIETIQSHYSNISESLSHISGSSVGGIAIDEDASYLTQYRDDLFNKIQSEINSFTPYEKFLYYDGQTESTASAPGVGRNYASTYALNEDVFSYQTNIENLSEFFQKKDGLPLVYKVTSSFGSNAANNKIDLFRNKYRAENKPFFNRSGSVYLSFLVKSNLSGSQLDIKKEVREFNGYRTPLDTLHYRFIQQPSLTGSEYRRYIIESSASYYVPTRKVNHSVGSISDWGENSGHVEVISSSLKTGSNIISAPGAYQNLATYVTPSGSTSDIYFTGSIMSSGDLFPVFFETLHTEPDEGPHTKITSSIFSDIKVTYEDPTNALPFDILYHTSSAEWQTWYNGMYSSASAFDEENIHSLENNLPTYIQNSSEYSDLKQFLGIQGEQFDIIRNYIDGFSTFHNREYKRLESVPTNLLPMFLQNMNWDPISPYTSSLATYFGQQVNSKTSIKDIENNTWRKTLNNLIYLYKSKGSTNSVRALLNIYGYPPDVLTINEFSATNLEQINTGSGDIDTAVPRQGVTINETDLENQSREISYHLKPRKLYHYRFDSKPERQLNVDWWMNGSNPNAVEFVYKHSKSTNNQEILKKVGSPPVKSTGSMAILSSTASHFDGKLLRLTSSDGTKKTYIFDDDNDGATGTLDSGKVRIQINGKTTSEDIAAEVSKSVLSTNGHKGKIDVQTFQVLEVLGGGDFFDSAGKTFVLNTEAQGSFIKFTQATASIDGNKTITTNAPSASVDGFGGGFTEQVFFDLRVIPSASVDTFNKFQFRLNNSSNGSASIESNAVSMSTSFITMSDGQLWNVMLQRMSSSVSGSGTQKYQLAAGYQKKSQIATIAFVSMSVSGGLSVDSNHQANKNWISTGSRPALSSSNLIVGRQLSGSLSRFRTWTTALSMSRFRQHTLNKFSTVGNSIYSHGDELIFHYKLNENYNSSSISSSAQSTINIVDSNPHGPSGSSKDFTFTKSSDIATGSLLYGFDIVEINTVALQDANQNRKNDNMISINRKLTFVDNINPYKSSVKSYDDISSDRANLTPSNKLEINRSPQDFIDNFILDKIQSFNLEKLYANPQSRYSSSYAGLDDFRKKFYEYYDLSVDTNKFIRSHENLFNQSIIEGVQRMIPARSTLSDSKTTVGVTIKPTVLERQRVDYKKVTLESNPNNFSASIDVTSNDGFKSGFSIVETLELPRSASISVNSVVSQSAFYESTKNGEISVQINNDTIYDTTKDGSVSLMNTINQEAFYESPKNINLSVENLITTTGSSLEVPKSMSFSVTDDYIGNAMNIETSLSSSLISMDNTIVKDFSIQSIKSASFDINNSITKNFSFISPRSASLNIDNVIKKESSVVMAQSASFNMDDLITKEFSIDSARSSSLSVLPSSNDMSIITPVTGTNTYITDTYTSRFENLSDLWGTTQNDVHFLNMLADDSETSSIAGNSHNVYHYEKRYHFYLIGDVEIYSGSFKEDSEFENFRRFFNRQNITTDTHAKSVYNSYINGNPGAQTGRAIGKTRYFFTGSDGTITFPSNHVRKFSYPFAERMYEGTRNTNPGIMNIENYKDLSTSSFYSVKVTGENILKVQRSGE